MNLFSKLLKTLFAIVVYLISFIILKFIYEFTQVVPIFFIKLLGHGLYFYWSHVIAITLYFAIMNDDKISFIPGFLFSLLGAFLIVTNIIVDGWLFKLAGIFTLMYLFTIVKTRFEMIGEV